MAILERDPVGRLFERVLAGTRDLELIDALFCADFLDHTAAGGAIDRDGLRTRLTDLRAAFPDVVFTLDASVRAGDLVATRWHWRGTHAAPFLGCPPTGRRVVVRGMGFYRIADERIAEHWEVTDSAALRDQIEPPGRRHPSHGNARNPSSTSG